MPNTSTTATSTTIPVSDPDGGADYYYAYYYYYYYYYYIYLSTDCSGVTRRGEGGGLPRVTPSRRVTPEGYIFLSKINKE